MAQIKTNNGIKEINGKIDKRSKVVARVKKYRDPITGEVIAYGPNEYYILSDRNVPLSEKQKSHFKLFGVVSRLASEIISNQKHPRYKEMYTAYINQISNANSIKRFDNFVCSTLYKEMI